MRITKESDYAVRALVDMAENSVHGPIQAEDISVRQGIPKSFLEQILRDLRLGGLIHTKKGPRGGYTLAVSPDKINLKDIIDTFEGSTFTQVCQGNSSSCGVPTICAIREAWNKAGEAANEVLASVTVGDLMRRQQERAKNQMYYI